MGILEDTMIFDPKPLRRARRLKGWKLKRLAAATGISIATYSRTLAGKSREHGTVAELANTLGVDVAECFPRQPEKEAVA